MLDIQVFLVKSITKHSQFKMLNEDPGLSLQRFQKIEFSETLSTKSQVLCCLCLGTRRFQRLQLWLCNQLSVFRLFLALQKTFMTQRICIPLICFKKRPNEHKNITIVFTLCCGVCSQIKMLSALAKSNLKQEIVRGHSNFIAAPFCRMETLLYQCCPLS